MVGECMKSLNSVCVLGLSLTTVFLLWTKSEVIYDDLKPATRLRTNKDEVFKLLPVEISSKIDPYFNPLTKAGNDYWSPIIGKQIIPGIFDDCQELFPEMKTSGLKVLPEDFHKYYDSFKSHFLKVLNGEKSEGTSLNYAKESMLLWNVAHYVPYIETICETGFNTGEGTVLWLSAKPSIKVYSFDIGVHKYARPMAKYLQEKFPGRHNITWGDSTHTIPKFLAGQPNITCDLLYIDGGHTYNVALADLENLAEIAYTGSIVVLDNYPDYRADFLQQLGGVWELKRQTGELIEIFKCTYGRKIGQGVSVAMLNKL